MSLVYPIQALAIGMILIQLMRHSAKNLRLLDRPNHRKLHSGEVPLIGGIGIFGSVVLSSIVVPGLSTAYSFLFLPALFVLVMGLLDDAWDIKPTVKLVGQILVAFAVLAAEPSLLLRLADGEAVGIFWTVLSWLLTVTLIVGAMNAFNMIDGVDGLAGGLAAIALCWLLVAAAVSGADLLTVMTLQVLTPVVAFLHFNARSPWRPRAAVFLGDAGSLVLGFVITVLGLQLAGPSKGGWSALALCFLIAVPAIDTLSLVARRLHAGRSPFAADRKHIHHLLQDAGLSPAQTTTVLIWAATAVGGLGLALDLLGVGSLALLGTLLALFVGHLVIVSYLESRILRKAAPKIQPIDVPPLGAVDPALAVEPSSGSGR